MLARPSLALAALAVALVVTACGGDSDTDRSTRPRSTSAGESVTVVGENIRFDTTELTATTG